MPALGHPRRVTSARRVRALCARLAIAAVLALGAAGCLIDRSAVGAGDLDAGAPALDAFVAPGSDAALDAAAPPADAAPPDVWAPPGIDAWAPDAFSPPDAYSPPDAWVPDAFVPPADAFSPPDAYVPPDAFMGCVARPETCNGVDDDCDGAIDDAACSIPVMGGGTVVCEAHTRGGSAYLVCRVVAGWDRAREICRGFSARYDLVAFSDGAEQDAVRPWSDIDVWMGLTDSGARVPAASDGEYRWVDGTAPSYDAWAPSEPRTTATDGCVVLQVDGQWDARSCADTSNTYGIVCEMARP
jgi:hypothetical protein